MEIEEFLDTFPEEIATLSRLTQAFVKEEAAECREELHVGWRVVSYGYKKQFCAIAPHAKWVNIQFYQGASLDDVSDLLEGSGKSMRHVKVNSKKDLSRRLARLIKQAATNAS